MVEVFISGDVNHWRVRCPDGGVDYDGPDLAEPVAAIDRAVGAATPLTLRTDLGQDTDYYIMLTEFYRDEGRHPTKLEHWLADTIFAVGLYGAREETIRRLLRVDREDV